MSSHLNPSGQAQPTRTPLNERFSPALLSFTLTSILFITGFLFIRPYYLTGDDGMMTLLSIGFGDPRQGPSEFLFHLNVLVGLVLKALNDLWPEHHWYGFFLFALYFVSTWAILSMFCSTFRSFRTFLPSFSVLTVVFEFYFAHMEFTILAFWAAQAGLHLMLTKGCKSEGDWISQISGGTLFYISSLVRLKASFLALGAMTPFCFFYWRLMSSSQKRRMGICAIAILGLTLGSALFHRQYYESHSGCESYYPWMDSFHEIVEYRGLTAGPSSEPILKNVGWDSLDFALFANFFWQDPKFSLDHLEKLEKDMPAPFNGKGIGWLKYLKVDFTQLLLMALVFFPFHVSRPRYPWVLVNILWVLVILLYLYYFKKITPWVIWPMLSFTALSFYFFGEGIENRLKPSRAFQLLQWIVFSLWWMAAIPLWVTDWRFNQMEIRRESQFQEEVQAIGFKPDKLSVIWNRAFPIEDVSVFGNYQFLKGVPFYWLSAWQNTPEAKRLLLKFNLENPFRDIVNRGDIQFILPENYSTMYKLYLQQRFHIDPTFQWVFQGNIFNVYQVKGKPIPKR